ncbi:macrophage mannose receptor 1-like isoform X5 [Oratosquilla oratoria]|uniref:macrophage mannose receptor 1-like isoform X5 n=1 Tax=Oratosquilla oratoria TaxID=337810 RepID=UPI003F7616F9
MNMPLRCDFHNGWEDVQGHCYKSKYPADGFNDALVQCALDDAYLVVIDSVAENQFVFDVAHGDYESVWIGLTEETHAGEWSWVYPQDPNSNYTNWSPDASMDMDGFGAAAISKYEEGKWSSEKISEELNYVCEKPQGTCATGWKEFEEHCYYFNTEDVDEVTWETANATCSSVGAYLVIVGSISEDAFIRTTMAETETLWLGLSSVPHDAFYWIDGTTTDEFTQMNADVAQTALDSDDRKCAYLRTTESDHSISEWIPVTCEETRHYVCEAAIEDPITMIPPQDGYYCPKDWHEYRGHCYGFGSEEETWTTARLKCQESGGDLASITTWQEQDFIHLKSSDDSWIGLNDREEEGKYSWSDGTKVNILNWDSGEPSKGDSNCVEQKYSSGKWNDVDCNEKKTYICKRHASATSLVPVTPSPTPPGSKNCGWNWIENQVTGECYRFYTDRQLSFQDANSYCKEVGYHSEIPSSLVTINSAQESLFLETQLSMLHISDPTLWIGLQNDRDGMRWVDGSVAPYTNWNENEPNKYYSENCIEMATNNYKWNDAVCSLRRGFICEKKGDAYVKPTPFPPPDVLCPEGWVAWDNYCYYFSKETATWDTAHTYCQSNYGSILASIKNADENDFIFKTMKGGTSINTWIGLHDDDKGKKWRWVDDSDFIYYKNWADGEPNHHNNAEHCGELRTTSNSKGKWNDMTCYTRNYYVCKMTVRTCPEGWILEKNKCYYASNYPDTWSGAQKRCREMNSQADLASIHSDDENKFLKDMLDPGTPATWIGLLYQYEKGTWKWSDGTDSSYLHWNQGEPNNIGSEFCGEMIHDSGFWNNLKCGESRNFACEVLPTHIVGCEPEWVHSKGYCYYFNYKSNNNKASKDFDEAQKECIKLDSNLVSIHSLEENDVVYSLLQQYYSYGVWIGLRNEKGKGYSWMDKTPVTYTSWDTEYSYKKKPCVYFSGSTKNNRWDKDLCANKKHYLCKKPAETRPIDSIDPSCKEGDVPYKTSCYKISDTKTTWYDAKRVCQQNVKGNLVVVNDRFEGALLSAMLIDVKTTAWIGLSTSTQTGGMDFGWVNGDPVLFTNWDEYEPDTSHGTCVSASGESSNPGLWKVGTCTEKNYYVCEYDREGYTTPPPPTTTPEPKYCRDGWERFSGKCYKVFQNPVTWEKAEEKCVGFGGHLTSVHSVEEQNFIHNLDGVSSIDSRLVAIWVGLSMLSDEEGYEWSDSSALNHLNWAEGQPDSHNGRERCVAVNRVNFQYSDYVCESYKPFICKTPEGLVDITTVAPVTPIPDVFCNDDSSWLLFSNHCYKIYFASEASTSWAEARRLCADEGSDLVSIHSYEENYWILSKAYKKPDRMLWAGGRAFYDSGFSWVDGSTFDFVNWAVDEPNNYHDQEDCMSFYSFDNGYWNDMNCGNSFGRICKRPHGSTKPPPSPTPPPVGQCPQGWIRLRGKCHYFSGQNVTASFEMARDACRALDPKSDLVSIHSEAESGFMTLLAGSDTSGVWIGLRKESGTFVWTDNSVVDYTNWAFGEPNDNENDWKLHIMRLQVPPPLKRVPGKSPFIHFIKKKHDDRYLFGDMVDFLSNRDVEPYPVPVSASEEMSMKAVPLDTSGRGNLKAGVMPPALHLPKTGSDPSLSSFPASEVRRSSLASLSSFSSSESTLLRSRRKRKSSDRQEHCVEVLLTRDIGKWNDVFCDKEFPFICQLPLDSSIATPAPVLMCDEPYNLYESFADSCYRFISEPKTWQEAEDACVADGAHLVSIQDLGTNSYLWSVMQNLEQTEAAWIGLNSIKSKDEFVWTDGWPTVYTFWGNWEPNVTAEDQRCASMNSKDGRWRVQSCNDSRSFFCMYSETLPPTPDTPVDGKCPDTRWMDLGGGFCYLIVRKQMSWSDANWQCLEEYSNLVSIHSVHERDLLLKSIKDITDPIWIGLTQRGEDFGWTDGTAMGFVDWETGEPNNKWEKCVEMYTTKGSWNDVTCGSIRSFVCKTPKIVPTTPPPPPTSPIQSTIVTPAYASSLNDSSQSAMTGLPGGIGAGGIVGIVIACLFIVVAAGFIAHQYFNKPKPIGPNATFGIDNALYSARDDGDQVAMTPKSDLATSTGDDGKNPFGGMDA